MPLAICIAPCILALSVRSFGCASSIKCKGLRCFSIWLGCSFSDSITTTRPFGVSPGLVENITFTSFPCFTCNGSWRYTFSPFTFLNPLARASCGLSSAISGTPPTCSASCCAFSLACAALCSASLNACCLAASSAALRSSSWRLISAAAASARCCPMPAMAFHFSNCCCNDSSC